MLSTSARLLRLAGLLTTRPWWTAAELADRLEVTTRTVRRDVDRLRELDYPVDSVPGPGGGYRLGVGAGLPPLQLEPEEAVAIAVCLRLAGAGGVTGIEDAAPRALAKLERMLPPKARSRVSAIEAATVPFGTSPDPVEPDVLLAVAQACRAAERLRFRYVRRDEVSTRRHVEPYRLVSAARRWYLVAFDLERDDWRTFRLDRMTRPFTTGVPSEVRDTPDPVRLVSEALTTAPYRWVARVRLHVPLVEAQQRIPPTVGLLEPDGDDATLLTAGADELRSIAGHLAMVGVGFTVLEPDELHAEVAAMARRLTESAPAGRPVATAAPAGRARATAAPAGRARATAVPAGHSTVGRPLATAEAPPADDPPTERGAASVSARVVQPDADGLELAAALLRAGRLVAFPTETVYGLGADGLDAAAVARIFAAKGRPVDNPVILHLADPDRLGSVVETVTPLARRLVAAHWPGPLTLVLDAAAGVPSVTTGGLATVAVRVPDHPVAAALLAAADLPVAAPSANRSGRPSPTTAAHVVADLGAVIDLVVDGGACPVGVESTVVDARGDRPVVLREGSITREQLGLGDDDASGELRASPGTRYRHYRPRCDVEVVRAGEAAERAMVCMSVGRRAGVVVADGPARALPGGVTEVARYRDAADLASQLYAALRRAELEALDVLVVEGVEEVGVGRAVMDRLHRAATGGTLGTRGREGAGER